MGIDPDKNGMISIYNTETYHIDLYNNIDGEPDIRTFFQYHKPSRIYVEDVPFMQRRGIKTSLYNSLKYKAIGLSLGLDVVMVSPTWIKSLKNHYDITLLRAEHPKCVKDTKLFVLSYVVSLLDDVRLENYDEHLKLKTCKYNDGAIDSIGILMYGEFKFSGRKIKSIGVHNG